MTATTATDNSRMLVPMRETPCDYCNDKAIARAYAWKDEQAKLWVGFCSEKCRNDFCRHT